MNARTKFIAGGVLIFGTAAVLMATSIRETGMAWLTPTELHAKIVADPEFAAQKVKVGARVVPGSIQRSANGRHVTFIARDEQRELRVSYAGLTPDTFSDSAEVILTGRLQPDGSFAASELLSKCASRFESAPDPNDPAYRSRPGYESTDKVKL